LNSSPAKAAGEVSLAYQGVSGQLMLFLQFFEFCVKWGFSTMILVPDMLEQGFPTWGTCTPRGTFAHLKGYI